MPLSEHEQEEINAAVVQAMKSRGFGDWLIRYWPMIFTALAAAFMVYESIVTNRAYGEDIKNLKENKADKLHVEQSVSQTDLKLNNVDTKISNLNEKFDNIDEELGDFKQEYRQDQMIQNEKLDRIIENYNK